MSELLLVQAFLLPDGGTGFEKVGKMLCKLLCNCFMVNAGTICNATESGPICMISSQATRALNYRLQELLHSSDFPAKGKVSHRL